GMGIGVLEYHLSNESFGLEIENIIIGFDNDPAGIMGAAKLKDWIKEMNINNSLYWQKFHKIPNVIDIKSINKDWNDDLKNNNYQDFDFIKKNKIDELEIINKIKNYQFSDKEITGEISRNKNIIKELLAINGNLLKYACDKYKDDEKMVDIAINNCPSSLIHASDRIRNDIDYINSIIKDDGWIVKGVGSKLKNNEEFMMGMIDKYKWVFCFASDFLKNKKDFVKKAVDIYGLNIKFASEEMKKDLDVCRVAYFNNKKSIQFFDKSIVESIVDLDEDNNVNM
ncbi:MAG: DUF4116 domain-containing protein, partial [Erysipelotrichaceae bacterium]